MVGMQVWDHVEGKASGRGARACRHVPLVIRTLFHDPSLTSLRLSFLQQLDEKSACNMNDFQLSEFAFKTRVPLRVTSMSLHS